MGMRSRWFVLCTVVAFFPAVLTAQNIAGSIAGSVRDPSGMAVAGASVALSQPATGLSREMKSDARGDFVFPAVLPGDYDLTVHASGFKTAQQRGVALAASETLTLGEITLQVGSQAETITVTAEALNVQTATAERAGVINSDQVENLMIRGRNVTSLLELLPGVIDLSDAESIDRNWNLAVNGNRRNTTGMQIDGMTTNQIGNNYNSAVSLGMDAVAEVKALTSNYQAEYGRMSGANIQLVTKSGTKQFHGMGSYFKRHEQFNAMNFFDNRLGLSRSPYRYNTWSYNVGGPVWIPRKFNRGRDRLFFFWSQEYWPIKTPQGSRQLTVPTELERSGDFSRTVDLNGKVVTILDPTTRTALPGNRMPASQIDANGQALLKIFPLPNFFDNTIAAYRYNYVFQSNLTSRQNMRTLKVDYNAGPKDRMFVNWSTHHDQQTGPLGLPDSGSTNWNQLVKTFDTIGTVLTGRFQHIFTPALINELNLGLSTRPERDITSGAELQRNLRDVVGFKTGQFGKTNNPLGVIPNATFGGVNSAANLTLEGRYPLDQSQRIFSITDNLTRVMGPHTLKAGIYLDRIWRDSTQTVAFNGSIDFGHNSLNPLTTNWAYANAMYGVFNSYSEASARPYMHYRVSNLEWFLQDNWRVTRRLTLDYGMRFYLVTPLQERDGLVAGFVRSRFDKAQQAALIAPTLVNGKRAGIHPVTKAIYPEALIGALAPGVGNLANGMVVPARDSSWPQGLIDNRGVQFGPRVGVAYDPFGKGRTALRAGFGIFYNRQNLAAVGEPFSVLPPLVNTPIIQYGTLSTLLTSSGLLFPQDVLGLDRAGQVPTVMNFSAGVQQRIWYRVMVDASYVGSLGRHLMWQKNLNAIPLGATFDAANLDATNKNAALPNAFLRPIIGYGNINMREWASTSNYHSLQFTANRRYAKSLQVGLAWTWSKAMDFNDNDTELISTFVPPRVWNYGLANYDRTHVVKINWLWDAPKTRWKRGVANQVFNGWQFSGITSFVSGTPSGVAYSIAGLTNITGSPTDGARIVVTGNPVLPKSERTFSRNFRTEVFQQPARGTLGNANKAILRGPGINNWNASVLKNFPVREGIRLQLRSEFYNAWNHTQFSAFDTTPRFDGAGNQLNQRFGEYTAARNARQMQFALRLFF